jgi:hypothetical protein
MQVNKINEFKFYFKIIPLFFGFVSSQKLILGGEIYLGEIFAIIYLFVNYNKIKIDKSTKLSIVLGVIWAFCQFFSDQINNVEVMNSIKGVGAPIIFIATLTALVVYLRHNIQRLPSFLIGFYLGFVPGFIIAPEVYFQDNPWKWGVGGVILGLYSVYFTFFIKSKNFYYLMFFIIILGVIGIINDARGLSLFPIFAGILYMASRSKSLNIIINKLKGNFFGTKITLIIILLIFFVNAAATAMFSSSWIIDKLPQESANKFLMQASGDYGVLLGGRTEIFASISAFLDKPFLGHGSWAKDNSGYSDLMLAKLFNSGYLESADVSYSSDLIPVHSYLMGAMVWSGIGGGLFWLFLIRWLLKSFVENINILGFYFYNGLISIIWSIMFSPFGAAARWDSAVFIGVYISYLLATPKHNYKI